jgi:XTP/dITP diphosphohydrolase
MTKQQIIYVTGNQMKVDYLNSVLGNEFEIIGKKIDCPELQLDEIKEIACHSAKYASDLLQCNVLKNDSGLVIPSLGGFPGPYSKYVEEKLDHDGILALMKNKTDRTAYYLDAFAYCEYGKEPVVFVSKSYGTIAKRKSGKFGNGYDKIFKPLNKQKTMASMSYKEFLSCIDDSGVKELANYLKNKAR